LPYEYRSDTTPKSCITEPPIEANVEDTQEIVPVEYTGPLTQGFCSFLVIIEITQYQFKLTPNVTRHVVAKFVLCCPIKYSKTNRQADKHVDKHTDRLEDGHALINKQTDKQTNEQISRQTSRQTSRQAGRQPGRQTDTLTENVYQLLLQKLSSYWRFVSNQRILIPCHGLGVPLGASAEPGHMNIHMEKSAALGGLEGPYNGYYRLHLHPVNASQTRLRGALAYVRTSVILAYSLTHWLTTFSTSAGTL
jgi:hypothetical protein